MEDVVWCCSGKGAGAVGTEFLQPLNYTSVGFEGQLGCSTSSLGMGRIILYAMVRVSVHPEGTKLEWGDKQVYRNGNMLSAKHRATGLE